MSIKQALAVLQLPESSDVRQGNDCLLKDARLAWKRQLRRLHPDKDFRNSSAERDVHQELHELFPYVQEAYKLLRGVMQG